MQVGHLKISNEVTQILASTFLWFTPQSWMLISLTLIWPPMIWIDDWDSLKWTIQDLQFFPPSHWHSLALNFVATWCTYTPSQRSEKEIKDFLSSLSLSVLNLTLDYQNMQFFCKKWITLNHLHFLPQSTFWFFPKHKVWIMTKTSQG